MGSRPRLHGGRLFAGMTVGGRDGFPVSAGMTADRRVTLTSVLSRQGRGGAEPPSQSSPQMGEEVRSGGRGEEGDGFPPPSARGQALRGNHGGGVGWVPASAGMTADRRVTLTSVLSRQGRGGAEPPSQSSPQMGEEVRSGGRGGGGGWVSARERRWGKRGAPPECWFRRRSCLGLGWVVLGRWVPAPDFSGAGSSRE